MNRDELLKLIRSWVYEARNRYLWFRSEDYRIILGKKTREKIIASDFFKRSFNHERETLFDIPVVIDEVYKNRLELVQVCRKEEQLEEDK